MQQEAREAALFLGEQVDGPLQDRVEAAGRDAGEGGSLRHSLVEKGNGEKKCFLSAIAQFTPSPNMTHKASIPAFI